MYWQLKGLLKEIRKSVLKVVSEWRLNRRLLTTIINMLMRCSNSRLWTAHEFIKNIMDK